MREFNVFPEEINGGKRTKFPADQLVDKAIESIVANAINFRKQHGLQRNEEKTNTAENKHQILFPCLKVTNLNFLSYKIFYYY